MSPQLNLPTLPERAGRGSAGCALRSAAGCGRFAAAPGRRDCRAAPPAEAASVPVGQSASRAKDFFALIVDNGSCTVKAGFAGFDKPRACSLWFASMPVTFGIMDGMDQKGFFKVVPRPIPMVFAAQADHGDSPVAVPQVVHLPVVAQRQFLMVQTAVGP